MCGPAQAAASTSPHASQGRSCSRRPSMQPSPALALVSQVETRARSAGGAIWLRMLKMSDAGSRPPDVGTALRWVWAATGGPNNQLSEDIVKVGMGFLDKRITDTLPNSQPSNRQSLLTALQAARMEWIRSGARLRRSLVWLPVPKRGRSVLQSSPRSCWSWTRGGRVHVRQRDC